MFDDLKSYFFESVITSYQKYAETKNSGESGTSEDIQAAINAAIALYHLREHLPNNHKKSRGQIAQECPDYNLLGDIVNAAKHHTITKGNPLVISAEDIFAEIVVTKYRDEIGEFFDGEKRVWFVRKMALCETSPRY